MMKIAPFVVAVPLLVALAGCTSTGESVSPPEAQTTSTSAPSSTMKWGKECLEEIDSAQIARMMEAHDLGYDATVDLAVDLCMQRY